LAGNFFAFALAVIFQWPLAAVLWPYWFQSLVIGYFSRKRMLALTDFSTEGMTEGDSDQPIPETEAAKQRTARFFVMHYGFFHAGYAVFLVSFAPELSTFDWIGLAATAAGFAWAHKTSYDRNIEADTAGRPKLSTMMMLPYLRVIPMHFAIMLGASQLGPGQKSRAGLAILLFFVLKTASDVGMHYVEHRILQKNS
jgi:hypothetical protein